MKNNIYQPATSEITLEGMKIARNGMRLKLWNDDIFAHKFLCHPNSECQDGCEVAANPLKLNLYNSDLEV